MWLSTLQTQLASMRMRGLIPGLTQWVKDPVLSCGVGRRRGSDPTLLWLWCRLAAVAPIQPLAWELPYAMGVALKRPPHPITYGSHGSNIPLV